MRNVVDKSSRENENTHFMLNNLFPQIVQLMRLCRKKCRRQGDRRQYGARALHAG
jgi:hypothetical protein